MLCGYLIKQIGVALILMEKEPKLRTTNREKKSHDVNTAYSLGGRGGGVRAPKVIILTWLGRPRGRGGRVCCCGAGGCSGFH